MNEGNDWGDPRRAGLALSPEFGEIVPSGDVLFGREDALSELFAVAEHARLLTLTGAPGVGKSRVARELASRRAPMHSDGGYLVKLSRESDRRGVQDELAATLAVERSGGQTLAEAIVERLHDSDALIVLDDCEDACGEFVEGLLRWCPHLAVVATCREAFGIAAETVWHVPPLRAPAAAEMQSPERLAANPAVALFLARAREIQPDFALTPYVAPEVAEITRRLDGLPLAIELSAERVDALTPAEIARRLDDRFDFLVARGAQADPRHRSLRSAIDRSYDLLGEVEQTALRRLSVFAGTFDGEAAAAVCSSRRLSNASVREHLDRMVAKSLVMAERQADGTLRYRLLETIRTYAGERLERSGEQAELRAAHARFYLALAEKAEPQLIGPQQDLLFEQLEQEHANLRTAFEFALAQGKGEWALRLSAALILFWRVRGHFDEGRDLLRAALASCSGAPDDLKAKAQWGEGFLCLLAGDPYGSMAPLEQSFAGYTALRDPRGQARSLLLLGNARQQQGDGSAFELLRSSSDVARAAGDAWCLAHALGCLGFEYLKHSGSGAARPLFEESLRVAEEAGDKQGRRWGLLGLGSLAGFQGDYGAAERLLRQGIALIDELQEDYLKAGALRDLGQVAMGQGRYDDARALLDESVALSRRFAPPAANVIVLCLRAQTACAERDWAAAEQSLEHALQLARGGAGFAPHALVSLGGGLLSHVRGDHDRATVACTKALELARASGERWILAHAADLSGRLARFDGDPRRARVLLEEALTSYSQLGNRRGIASALEGIGGLACEAGEWERAVRLLAAANALRERGASVRMPWESPSFDDDMARAREVLPGPVFALSLREGAGVSCEEVVAQALRRPQRGRPTGGWPSLTPREREVALLAGEGLTNPEIAERLVISRGTVKNHLAQVFPKLGISKRSELVRDASRQLGGPSVG